MWTETLGTLAWTLTVPGSLYLAALTAAATWPRQPAAASGPAARAGDPSPRVVILVPAHDESLGLVRTLRSLRRETAGDPLARVVVIADNCSDDTADVALAAGVEVLERHDPQRRGKGHALQFGFSAIGDADWFIVIDADTDVQPGFLAAMRRGMASGAQALQCRYGVRDAEHSRRAALADVALGAWNTLRPRGRARLGLSAGILGNGFALSRHALAAVPYTARSIVEDVEYHHLLVRHGLRVGWVDDAQVKGDMPSGAAGAAQQRSRWEGGRLRLLIDRGPALLTRILRGHWRLADALLDLLTMPLAWHVSLLLAALLLAGPWVQGAATLGLLAVQWHVALALRLIQAREVHLQALLGVPAYVLWKLRLAGATWRSARADAAWLRSPRSPL